MTSSNLNIILTNAVCYSANLAAKVSKLYSIGDKCADLELVKLKLLNDYIETLRCYQIDPINAKFTGRSTTFNNLSNPLKTYVITINGVSNSMAGDGVLKVVEILSLLMDMFTETISYSYYTETGEKLVKYTYTFAETTCDVESIQVQIITTATGVVTFDGNSTPTQTGVCYPTSCLTEEEYNTLIEYVMKTCDICECQLT